MRKDERAALRRRFQFRCGYCGVREQDAGAELTIDHFQPRSNGGVDEPDNWVYCCHACNEFKGDYWQPESPRRILHPFRDALAIHIVEEPDGTMRGLSEVGLFHINQLHLNRVPLIEFRLERRLREAAYKAAVRQLEDVETLEEEAQAKAQRLDHLRSGDGTA